MASHRLSVLLCSLLSFTFSAASRDTVKESVKCSSKTPKAACGSTSWKTSHYTTYCTKTTTICRAKPTVTSVTTFTTTIDASIITSFTTTTTGSTVTVTIPTPAGFQPVLDTLPDSEFVAPAAKQKRINEAEELNDMEKRHRKQMAYCTRHKTTTKTTTRTYTRCSTQTKLITSTKTITPTASTTTSTISEQPTRIVYAACEPANRNTANRIEGTRIGLARADDNSLAEIFSSASVQDCCNEAWGRTGLSHWAFYGANGQCSIYQFSECRAQADRPGYVNFDGDGRTSAGNGPCGSYNRRA
ncbi:unnamed protein product [Cercospora beticola]|nr:unnamed protein product [Cercospora beticola]